MVTKNYRQKNFKNLENIYFLLYLVQIVRKKTSEDELSDFMKYLCESLSSGFEGVKDVAMLTKYKKTRIIENKI